MNAMLILLASIYYLLYFSKDHSKKQYRNRLLNLKFSYTDLKKLKYLVG